MCIIYSIFIKPDIILDPHYLSGLFAMHVVFEFLLKFNQCIDSLQCNNFFYFRLVLNRVIKVNSIWVSCLLL